MLAAAIVAFGCIGDDDKGAKETRDAKAAADAPNFVVIQSDDQSLESMRVMSKTKRLLGDRGATFANHFANWPLCCPSRATQLTGQYAHNHGVLGNSPPEGSYLRLPRHDNIAVWLKEAGYELGHIGKFLNGYGPKKDDPETPVNDVTEVPRGWSDWRTGSAGTTYGYYDYVQNEWSSDDGKGRDGELAAYGGGVGDFKTDANTSDALDLIGKYADGEAPFYLQVDYLAPHTGGPNRPRNTPHPPYDCRGFAKAAPRDADAYDDAPLAALRDPSFNEADVSDKPPDVAGRPRLSPGKIDQITAGYRCELESMLSVDDGVANIVRRLKATGELENTYVFYMGDNGFLYGEHRLDTGKNNVYEPAIRIPLLLRGPGVPAGVEVWDLTSNADFATTVMALAGAEFDEGSPPDGRSLLPPIGHPEEEIGRELLIESNGYAAIRTQRYKWVEHEDGFVELYDLKSDPYEEQNVAGESAYEEVQGKLVTRLQDLRECAAAECTQTPGLEIEPTDPEDACVLGLSGADVPEVESLTVRIGAAVAGRDASEPFAITVSAGELPRSGRVAASATLIDGRRMTRQLSLRTCR